MLTLQMIRLMEILWKKEGLDLRYSRGSTQSQMSFLWIDPSSVTVALPPGWYHTAACPPGTRWGSSRSWRTPTPLQISSVTAATVPPLQPSTRTLCSTGSNLRIQSECDGFHPNICSRNHAVISYIYIYIKRTSLLYKHSKQTVMRRLPDEKM